MTLYLHDDDDDDDDDDDNDYMAVITYLLKLLVELQDHQLLVLELVQ